MSDSLQPHGLQHARPPCPSPSPGAYSSSCPLSLWCHPTILSSVIPFSSCPQSFPTSGSFQMSQFFASSGEVLEFHLQRQSFQWIFRTDLLQDGLAHQNKSAICICPLFGLFFPSMSPLSTESSFLSYEVGLYKLSILHSINYIIYKLSFLYISYIEEL